jgi:transposase InsO family protein
VYKTDNGSPFQSYQFKAFAEKWGFRHRRVTPEWPRANGKAESFMKELGKVLKTAQISGMDEQEALLEFLRR